VPDELPFLKVGDHVRVRVFGAWRGRRHWPVGRVLKVGRMRVRVAFRTPTGKQKVREGWFRFRDIRKEVET
jgi:hypothetical protein